jgi:hypothetical protein
MTPMAEVKVPRGRRVVGYVPAPGVFAVNTDGRRVPVVCWMAIEDSGGDQELHGLVLRKGVFMSAEHAWGGLFSSGSFDCYEVDGEPILEA